MVKSKQKGKKAAQQKRGGRHRTDQPWVRAQNGPFTNQGNEKQKKRK